MLCDAFLFFKLSSFLGSLFFPLVSDDHIVHCPLRCLPGTTTKALTQDRPWLLSHLSTVASGVAISIGVLMLIAELGFAVPLFS